ncbi:phosphate/phosphite/phosphonate ABC transporter substrate-binding protein [Aliivibrio sp. S3MY1]|uniref:phosphate/phosphite/phosphonate ABC transporter substrate-binding protein n=1 Tax=unclassified Aliivibrio TaxID=2645654 RepID=UPI0023790B2B|nr:MULTISPECIES: phosphate/phosphite/phosphonate ABC transporter substrate-binding protein [unclassified Aliivibrio]MDD9194437.1 phosphate/phosphite/phosphonate ABC transporter substrate-binding protein [Aliivibrio sp. S3MY1]MDD9198224.1 phosphate/phosphite/phosphonate ABC transporter substrate-binding protein [Aliivibrio sp. S2MY1]
MRIMILAACLLFSTMVLAKKTLIVGVVPQFESHKIREIWQPVIDELSYRTGLELKLQQAIDIPSFEKELANEVYDIVYLNPYHLLMANDENGYLPIIKDSTRLLSGILVVSKESGITSIEQLNNQEIAFPAPNALGASLMTRAELTRKNIEFTPVYVHSHSSAYLNTVLGVSRAGGGVVHSLKQQKQSIQDKLTILYQTSKVAPHPIALHPRVIEQRQVFYDAFKGMFSSESGKNKLSKIPMRGVEAAELSDYDNLKMLNLEQFIER